MADTRDLTTLAAVKSAIQLPASDTDLDTLLPNLITEASVAIMDYCKREFAPVSTATTRRFKVDGYRVDFSPYDLETSPTPTVRLHPETTTPLTLTTDQYSLSPVSPQRGVYQSIQFSGYLSIVSQTLMAFNYALVDVTGTWGFASVPVPVRRACNITVGSWLTRTAPGASAQYGVPMASGAGATTFRNDWDIPWAACKLLGRYRRGSARWIA